MKRGTLVYVGIAGVMAVVSAWAVWYFWRTLREARAPVAQEVLQPWTTDHLYGVDFVDRQHGWAVGYWGTILCTTDGGAHWRAQRSGVTDALVGVDFVNARVGWVVGRHGVILHTADGGRTWKRQPSGTKAYLIRVQFLDEREGWVCGDQGLILHTTDGGRTWQVQHQPKQLKEIPLDITQEAILSEAITLNDIRFVNAREGWAVGEYGFILHTTDGGRTWKRQPSGTREVLYGVDVLGSRGLIVGAKGTCLVSQDGGRSWTLTHTGYRHDLYRVRFDPSPHGQARGTALAVGKGWVLFTFSGGREWAQRRDVDVDLTYRWLYDLCFATSTDVWAVGGRGLILYSSDGGVSWSWARRKLVVFR